MTADKLQEFFEEKEFRVYLTEQDGNQCAEVEKWTKGGVDMVIWLNPFTVEEFKSYVDDFDIDEEIELHRQGERYKAAFTISQSLKDFGDFHRHLKKVYKELVKESNKVLRLPKLTAITELKKVFTYNNSESWGKISNKQLSEWYTEYILKDKSQKIKLY